MKKYLLVPVFALITMFIFNCKGEEGQPQMEKAKEVISTPESIEESTTEKAKEAVEEVAGETKIQEEAEQKAPQSEQVEEKISQVDVKVGEKVEEIKTQREEAAPIIKGSEIYQKKGCVACHQPNLDTVGPSLEKIAKIYKEQNVNLLSYLKGEGTAIVDPPNADKMKPSLTLLKSLTEAELKALTDFILER